MKLSLALWRSAILATALGGVAHAQVLISEVFYDAVGADDNLEWIELVNVGGTAVDLSTWSLGWGGGDYTYGGVQLSGLIPPGGTFVIGGPVSGNDNGNPGFDQSVLFANLLQNGGSVADGIALFNMAAASVTASTVPVDVVIYGTTNSNGLIDESGSAGAEDAPNVSNGHSIERINLAGTWIDQAVPTPGTAAFGPPAQLLISEVLYDALGTDDQLEWVEIVNIGNGAVDLSYWSLGWGGSDYTYGTLQLAGTIPAGGVFVIGGPVSSSDNGSPVFNQGTDFHSDLQNSGDPADGLALFNVPGSLITVATVPVDAVIYGAPGTNSNGLLDETGGAGEVDVADTAQGESIERIDEAGTWQVNSTPSPGFAAFAIGGPVVSVKLVSSNLTTGDFDLEITMATDATVDIDFNGTLAGGGWDTRLTTALVSGTQTVGVSVTTPPDGGFFRVLESWWALS
ncbi:MAG: lamin tail domain-containing protein [Verrucomicrobia bacterium]|nr:lamin tail domain-containing protein [Verrucomicrobiota bacterium]